MKTRAFSLVELSLVLVILGLLTGGVLAGKSLIRAAELRAYTTELEKYIAATNAFKTKYGELPGDISNAASIWSTTTSGDGNGRVYENGEFFLFWQHLALAGLIEGSYSGLTGPLNGNDHLFGQNSPESRVPNTGWGVFYRGNATGNTQGMFDGVYKHSFLHGARSTTTGWPEAAALKPDEAWSIDTKIDDGKPGRGKLLGLPWTTCTNASDQSDLDTTYKVDSSSIACVLRTMRTF